MGVVKGACSKFLRMLQTCPGFLIGNYAYLAGLSIRNGACEEAAKL